jgi:hypothetical protein
MELYADVHGCNRIKDGGFEHRWRISNEGRGRLLKQRERFGSSKETINQRKGIGAQDSPPNNALIYPISPFVQYQRHYQVSTSFSSLAVLHLVKNWFI